MTKFTIFLKKVEIDLIEQCKRNLWFQWQRHVTYMLNSAHQLGYVLILFHWLKRYFLGSQAQYVYFTFISFK